MVGLHNSITMSFMLVGHTKFSPDWCFGLLKQKYQKSYVSCLQDIVDVVNQSADVNTAQLVGLQDGEVLVPIYDWATFLGEHFRKVPQLKSYHHFTFHHRTPGLVRLKKFSDSTSTSFQIMTDKFWVPTTAELPPQILPSGLSNERQWYLYNEIREFCRHGTKDLVCPLPSAPQQHTNTREDDDIIFENNGVTKPPVPKRPRRCGICRAPGHTRTTCPEGGGK